MSRRKYSATAPVDDFIEQEMEKRGPRFRAEVDAAYAEMVLEQQLIELREKEGVTQAELARRLGVSQPVVARFEARRNRGVELATIVRHAFALGYEFVVTFKKLPAARQAPAQAAGARSVRTPTKRSKPVTEKATGAARRKRPRSK